MQCSGCFDSAYQPLHLDTKACWLTIVYHLTNTVHGRPDFIENYNMVGLLLGKEGEECMCFLCSMAMDLAVASQIEHAASSSSPLQSELALLTTQCNLVYLKVWLCELLDSKHLNEDLLWWMAKYHINFLHYLELTKWVIPGEMDLIILLEGWWYHSMALPITQDGIY